MNFLNLSDYNRETKIFWAVLMCIGLPLVAWAVYGCFALTTAQALILGGLAVLVAIAGLFPVRVPGTEAGVTASDAFVFLGLIFLGVPAAVLLGAFDVFLCSVRMSKQTRAWLNAPAITAISFFLAGTVFYQILALCGETIVPPLGEQPIKVQSFMAAFSGAVAVGFLSNNLLIAALLALKERENVFKLFFRDLFAASFGSLAGAMAAGIIYETVVKENTIPAIVSLPLIVLPLLAYRTYFRRLEKSMSEAVEASRLYMSAIESLSNAIEAREQMSPGHTRRVQIYAVEFAQTLGLSSNEIKALELAAMLHGIGKLAVPDYILNKPDSLTSQEKERVKLYPLVSAEIVEAVDFPYPVADAVKFYNESWDGFGYPEGLKGEEIPAIARILGIVDAFDTMREPRPFRPACTREEARKMLLAGAGTKFDPKLVDIFLRNLTRFETRIIAAGLPLDGRQKGGAPEAEKLNFVPHYLEQISRTNREVFALYELARLSSASLSMNDLLSFLTKKVHELVPSETCVVYLYNAQTEIARAVYTSGKNAAFLRDREVRLGEGVIGYTLKNEKAVGSVSPALDFKDDCVVIAHDYTTMAALPLLSGKQLIGALAIYAENLPGYDEEHLRLLDTISRIAAESISRALQHEESENRALTDALTGLPNARALRLQFDREVSRARRTNRPFQFIMLDLDEFKKVNDTFGHKIGDEMLCEISQILRGELRDYDFLARYAGDEFVAILPELSNDRVHELCFRIEQAVSDFALPVDGKNFARVGVSIGAATYPLQGGTLDQLMVAADQNMYSAKAVNRDRRTGKLDASLLDPDILIHQSIN